MSINEIDIKERIAADARWSAEERDYILRAINRSIQVDRIELLLTKENHPALSATVEIINGDQNPLAAMAEFVRRKLFSQ